MIANSNNLMNLKMKIFAQMVYVYVKYKILIIIMGIHVNFRCKKLKKIDHIYYKYKEVNGNLFFMMYKIMEPIL